MTAERMLLAIRWLMIIAGLALALLSWTDLCSFSGCTDAHEYRFFGLQLQLVGTLYFILLALTQLLPKGWPGVGLLFTLLLGGGVGSELVLIHIQKNVIKAWCPLCLGIAAALFLLCIFSGIELFRGSRRLSIMNRSWFVSRGLLLIVALAAGFMVSFAGIKKPEAAGAEAVFGKQSAKVELLLFSDWLCPMCLKIEPVIESIYPQLEKKVKIQFIDKAVHKESMNFVPYHLSFLVNEKAKYMQLRKALFELAKVNKNPGVDDVSRAIAPLGVTYRQLSFMEVSQMMAKAQALANEYKVNGTPTLVIRNGARSKTLVGGKDINADSIMKAIKALE